MFDLAFVWAALIAFAVLAYVLFDGFDLGIGILFPRLAAGAERDQAMNSVAPVWDGNETWLVLGGGGLMAAFPLAYAVVLPALYAPITGMLLGLIFRGVAFGFRFRLYPPQAVVGRRLCRRFDARRLRPGRGARRPGARHPGGGARLRRRLVGLAELVQSAHRVGARRRLCPTGRHVAGVEDQRPGAAKGLRRGLGDGAWHAGADWARQRHHAVPRSLVSAALVQLAQHGLRRAGPDPGRARRRAVVGRPVAAVAARPLLGGGTAVRAVLHWPRYQFLSLYPAALADDLGGGGAGGQSPIFAGGCPAADPL